MVLRLVGLDIERGRAQVTVVSQRLADQLAQHRVLEHLLPILGRLVMQCLRSVGHPVRELSVNGGCGALIVRCQ
ncbi:hypothetical protein D3C80_2180930 [compost metagenome]